jgi:cephalosporin-C deacetylase
MFVDWPLDRLRDYRPARDEPADFDDFWATTLREARDADWPARFVPYDAALATVEVYDVTFAGYAGQPVRGWFLVPRGATGPLPCVVEYIGYGGGRGLPHEWLAVSAAGYANLIMDTRGQGSNGWSPGDTPDPDPVGGPQTPGFMTRGISDPHHYYYRRLFTDAVRAVDAARAHPLVDPERVVVGGTSQGGGIAIATAGLVDGLAAALPNVPFLCHYRRASEITDDLPYAELVTYLKTHRREVDRVFRTLGYFDGVNFASRATAPTLFSVALMDSVCPPSTVFAAYNHWSGGDREITVWPYNGHEGGAALQRTEQLHYLRKLFGTDQSA